MANEDMPQHETEQLRGTIEDFSIRPLMRQSDIRLRRSPASVAELNAVKKALRTLHSLEIMAVNIYRFQISKQNSELNVKLISAMCNEMTHVQDFQVKLYEYGLGPSKMRWIWWMAGFFFGFFSRLIGRRMILKTGIWVESKAVKHYRELLTAVKWDEDTRKIIEKDQSDEQRHINQWKNLLEIS